MISMKIDQPVTEEDESDSSSDTSEAHTIKKKRIDQASTYSSSV
jgi:hypothetical protein